MANLKVGSVLEVGRKADLATLFGTVSESLSHIAATGIIIPRKRVPVHVNA